MRTQIQPGDRFGSLTAVGYHEGKWLCRCDCGENTRVLTGNLRQGNTKSCGCLSRRKHGMAHSREYGVWKQMIQRCENQNNAAYANYGGRGIEVCERWHSFPNFIADMGKRPGDGFQIDRIDNDDGYHPTNCRWVPPKANLSNKRTNVRLTSRDQTQVATEWARIVEIKPRTLLNRIERGWSTEDALNTPVAPPRRRQVENKHTAFGKSMTLSEWAAEYGIDRERLRGRLRMGYPLEQALTKTKGN